MTSNFFVSCVDSRMEEETNWYSRFEIGPFQSGQALTVANSLRRTLLSEQQGVFLTAVEIDGAIHEYSRLEGLRQPILEILLNLRQVSLILNEDILKENLETNNQETFIGYFDLQGPMEVKAKDLKFPKHIECSNPNQLIATLTRNCSFQGRFLIMRNSSAVFSNQSIGDPVLFGKQMTTEEGNNKLLEKNWLYVNPIMNAVRRVNYSVEQFGDVWDQKEVVVLELWTNGTVHPKQAILNACSKLASIFSSLAAVNLNIFKVSSVLNRFKKIKNDTVNEVLPAAKGSTETIIESQADKLTLLFDLDIANLNLSLKTYLLLKKGKVENIGNLLQYKKSDLTRFLLLSSSQIEEIESALKIFGLTFL